MDENRTSSEHGEAAPHPRNDDLSGVNDLGDQTSVHIFNMMSPSQNKLDEALLTSRRVTDDTNTSLVEWLSKADATLAEDQAVSGDLDTISMLVEKHTAMQQELGAIEQTVAAMKADGNISIAAVDELESTWYRVNKLSDIRETKLRDSLKKAEEFQKVVQFIRDFLPKAESKFNYKTLPEDEIQIKQLIERHEEFREELRNNQECIENIRVLANEIVPNCHPGANKFDEHYLSMTQTRWDHLLQRAKTMEGRLQDALHNIQGNAALVEELLAWMSEAYVLLSTKERDPIPDDLNTVETLYKEHVELHADIGSKKSDVERFTKLLIAKQKSPGHHYESVLTLQNTWPVVWRKSLDRKTNLQDALDDLLELKSLETFDFNVWKQRYLNWIKVRMMRTTDFFRRQDKDGDGYLSRDEFVDGMLQSGFMTSKRELHAVFDIINKDNKYYMQYNEFIVALKPDRHQKTRLKSGEKQMTDSELLQYQIDKDVSQCQCRNPFNAQRMSNGKYRFGEIKNIICARFLNSTVMVQLAGDWVTLNEFLETSDPCRSKTCKRKTNIRRRDSLLFDRHLDALQSDQFKYVQPAPNRCKAACWPTLGLKENIHYHRAVITSKKAGTLTPPPKTSTTIQYTPLPTDTTSTTTLLDQQDDRRFKSDKKQELIQDQIDKDVSQCQCRNPFNAQRMSEGEYRFGEEQNIRLVRFLNSTVKVQVRDEWVPLNEFLKENDPCRLDRDLLPFTGTSDDFHKLLSTGTYKSYENRVFLCGSCACGKSTLASVLIGSSIPLTWKSTDGLVIHFGRNGINLETYEMVPLKEEDAAHNLMTKLIIGNPNREVIAGESTDIKQELCIATSSTCLPVSHLQVIKENTSFSSDDSDLYIRQVKHLQGENITISEMKKVQSIHLPQLKKIEAYAVHDDILKEVKSGQYKIKIAPSDLVDFGGQRSYDMTHQLFVQHGGTFVVMFDGSKDFQEPLKEYPTGDISNESIVKHWVDSILTYCVDDDDVMPKILFAATHSDRLSNEMQKEMNMKFVKKISEMFSSHEMKDHIVFEPVFFINGTNKDDHDIQNLTNQLVTIAKNQPSWGLRRPLIWVPLELMIVKMIEDNVHIIPKTQLAEANVMNKDLALSERQLDDFLLAQHSLGKLMYFNQPDLNNFIILYPPALVNILRSFVTDEIFWPENEALKSILRRMRETGKLYKNDLLTLWQQEQFVDLIQGDDSKEFIIQVLVHLDVLVLPKQYNEKSDTHFDYFLVPCTVKHRMPMSFLNDKSFANRTIALVYQIQKSSIPSALSFKLIGAVSGIWPIKEVEGRPQLYHSAAVLSVDSNTEFRIIVDETRVVVYLTNMSSSSCISPDIAASIQECLTVTLQAVLKFYRISIGKNQKQVNVTHLFNIGVGEVCGKSPCVVSISKAKQTSYWMCENGNKHSSRRPLLWFFNKKQEECPSQCQGLETTALEMSPSEKHLSRLACHLDINSCRELMIHLGLKPNEWNDIDYSYTRMPIVTKIMALNFWKTKTIRGKPTKSFNDLLNALNAVGDNIHLLCKVFREDTDLLGIAETRLQEVPHDDVLKDLPKNLGNCAIQLGIELGVSISAIEETLTRHPRDMYDQIEEILKKWKSSKNIQPTIYRLMLALERVHTGGCEYLKDIYIRRQ